MARETLTAYEFILIAPPSVLRELADLREARNAGRIDDGAEREDAIAIMRPIIMFAQMHPEVVEEAMGREASDG